MDTSGHKKQLAIVTLGANEFEIESLNKVYSRSGIKFHGIAGDYFRDLELNNEALAHGAFFAAKRIDDSLHVYDATLDYKEIDLRTKAVVDFVLR